MLARIRMIAAVTILAGGYLLSAPRPVAASQAFSDCPSGPVPLADLCGWCGEMPGCRITGCHFDSIPASECGCNYSC